MQFSLCWLSFHMRAVREVEFPAGNGANKIRGALGSTLEADIFRPVRSGPSGLADPPRPFVLRASHLDGTSLAPGESFLFHVHLFDPRPAVAAALERAVSTFGWATPVRASAVNVTLSLTAAPEPVSRVSILFLTPTELKTAGGLAVRPEFDVLMARVRDRISTLSDSYGGQPLAIDHKAMGERACAVIMTQCDIRHVELSRRSSRTGQKHPLGGFTGEATYEGDLAEFLPWLRAAEWTGVGRQTVWGKGEIRVLAA